MKIKNMAILSILAINLLSGCNDNDTISEKSLVTKAVAEEIKVEKVVNSLPTFNLITTNNKPLKVVADNKNGWIFGNIKDKVVLLDFYGTWCPPCKAEIPHLNNIRKKLGKEFEIIGIDIGNRRGQVNSNQHMIDFINKYHIKYPLTVGGDNSKLLNSVSELNPQGSIPFMILFDKKGRYLKYYIGMTPEEMIMSDIKQAIKIK